MHVRRFTFVRLVAGSLAREVLPLFPLCRHGPGGPLRVFSSLLPRGGGGHGSPFAPPLARLFQLVSFQTVTSKRANAKVSTIYGQARRTDASLEFFFPVTADNVEAPFLFLLNSLNDIFVLGRIRF